MKILYAIVDIETTGGHADGNGITEIAIFIFDGDKIIEQYQTLINPKKEIPIYIQALTGIGDEMVRDAPDFDEVAEKIHTMLKDRVFVAHNVNFDYSFVKHHLQKAGYELNCKRLCTVRLSRKLIPGFASYNLGKLCSRLGISIENRHRAGGDAAATVQLFKLLLDKDKDNHIKESLKVRSKEQILPPNLPKKRVGDLPQAPGVYYFHDRSGKVIYVGKALNIKKRVNSHFTSPNTSKRKQELLRMVHDVSFQLCGNELHALVFEAVEIKRLWPLFNRAQKRFEPVYGLYLYEDGKGYFRLVIDKKQRFSHPKRIFNGLVDANIMLNKLIETFHLCPKLCAVQINKNKCIGMESDICLGACEGVENPEHYNKRVEDALESIDNESPSYAIVSQGRNQTEHSCLLIEKGQFYGMGYLSAKRAINDIADMKKYLTPYPSYDYIKNMLYQYAINYPEQVVLLDK